MKKRRGSSRYFFIFFLLLIVLGSLGYGMRMLITKISFFNINKIEVTGNTTLESDFLSNLAGDFIGQNLYAVSKKNVMVKFNNIIRVKDVTVVRMFPDKLKIKIRERRGVFSLITADGELFPIDDEFVILDNDNFSLFTNIPMIHLQNTKEDIIPGMQMQSDELNEIFSFYTEIRKIESDFFDKVSEIFISDEEIHVVEKNKGYLVIFGNDSLEDQLKQFSFIEENRDFEVGSTVDLRFEDQLIIRTEVR
jgi:cell division septal protein FtsQ